MFAARSARHEHLNPDDTTFGYTWRRACIGAGLMEPVMTVTGPTETVPRIVQMLGPRSFIVRLLPGQLPADVRLAGPRLAPAMGAAVLRVEPVDLQHIRVDLLAEDPLAQVVPYTPAAAGEPVLLGRGDDGRAVELDWRDGAHTAIQGVTRSGKSVLSYATLAQLAANRDCVIAGLDPTGLLLRPFRDTRHAKWQHLGVKDMQAHADLLGRLCDEMDERITDLPLDRDTIEINEDQPAMVVVLEEYPGLLRVADTLDKDIGKAIRAYVARLLAEGAKVGYRVIMLAQRMEAQVVGAFERAMCSTRISFRTDSPNSVDLLHPGADREIAAAHTAALPGVGLISEPGRELGRFRAVYLGGYPQFVAAVRAAVALADGTGDA